MVALFVTWAAGAFAGSGARLVPQVGHDGPVSHVEWSADGARIVTASATAGTTCVWHAATGNLLAHLEGSAHDHRALSPDGARIVTALSDEAVVWDVATGEPVHHLRGHQGAIWSAQYSPDGARILTLSEDHTLVLWDAATGALQRRLDGNEWFLWSAEFTADGAQVWTIGDRLSVWDAATGELLRAADADDVHPGERTAPRVAEPALPLGTRILFSPDRKRLLLPDASGLVLRDAATWKPIVPLEAFTSSIFASFDEVRFSPDGRYVVGAIGADLVLWDVRTGKIARRLSAASAAGATAFSADGRQLAAAHEDHTVTVWDVASGQLRSTLTGHADQANTLAFSPDGARLVSGDDALQALEWDLATGELLATLVTRAQAVLALDATGDGRHIETSTAQIHTRWDTPTGALGDEQFVPDQLFREVRFSPDGAQLAVAGNDHVEIRDVLTNGARATLATDHPVTRLSYSPDGQWLAGTDAEHQTTLWRAASGAEVARYPGVDAVAFAADGARLALGRTDGSVTFVAVRKWKAEQVASGQFAPIVALGYSPDGTRLVSASTDGTATVWDAVAGEPLTLLEGHGQGLLDARYTPDGGSVVTAGLDGQVVVWDPEAATPRFTLDAGVVSALAFTPDGQRLVTGNADGLGAAWDLARGQQVATLAGHANAITDLVVTADGRHVFTASWDATARVYDAQTGREQGALLSFFDGSWAVVDPAGRFDASNDGDVDGLVWVIDGLPYSLSQLRDQYYDPGLLAKIMGFRDEELRVVPDLSAVAPPARAHLDGPDGSGQLRLKLEDRGGGIGAVHFKLNGSDATDGLLAACPTLPTGTECAWSLAGLPTWNPGAANQVEIEVGNAQNLVASRGLDVRFEAEGDAVTDPPDLWVLAVGTGQFSSPSLTLTYAAADAKKFADALRVAGARGFTADHTHVKVLATQAGAGVDDRPTRAALVAAFEWLRQSDPLDTVVVFFSGHGVAFTDPLGGVDDYFYLLPDAASFTDVRDAMLRPLRTWSGTDLSDALATVPALKRVVVMDTCAAGKIDEPLTAARDLSSDAIRAHARARDRTGAWLLAGAAADRVSYEASRYGQGVLTYSLLEGMSGPALDADHLLYVSRLFSYAEDKVPVYAAGVGGVQKPVVRRGEAQDFPIGEVTAEDRGRLDLGHQRPVVVRASVQGDKGRQDPCALTEPLNRALRDEANQEKGAFVKWETTMTEDAWALTGYCTDRGGLAFSGFLTWTGEGKTIERPLKAKGPDADVLSKLIAQKVAASVGH